MLLMGEMIIRGTTMIRTRDLDVALSALANKAKCPHLTAAAERFKSVPIQRGRVPLTGERPVYLSGSTEKIRFGNNSGGASIWALWSSFHHPRLAGYPAEG